MKEKAVGLAGTILGVVGYLLLKELFVSIGMSSLLAIIMAIASLIVIVYAGIFIIGYVLDLLKTDEQKAKEKELEDEYIKEIERKIKEDEKQSK